MHNLYKSALALRVLFYFLRSLYIYSSPYLTRDTHYRLINILLLGYYCVSHIRITWLYQQLSYYLMSAFDFVLTQAIFKLLFLPLSLKKPPEMFKCILKHY
jgi:hypothetical protein